MELASKIREAINSADETKIRAVYFETFGKTVKKDCNNCYNEAVGRLIKFAKQKTNMSSQFKFKKEFENDKVTLKIGGSRQLITAENLTDELAELLFNNGRGHILEENKNAVRKADVLSVKKITPETFSAPQEKPLPTLSTLSEAKTDGKELAENVSEKVSEVSESQPLTAKKRGRKPKDSK